jgi:hypothetical protein
MAALQKVDPKELTSTQLMAKADSGWQRLDDKQQAYVVRIVDLHEPPFTAARQAGLRSMPRSKAVLSTIAILRELRRRDPITDPSWISDRYRNLFNTAYDAGQLDVARRCLTDLATFEGHMPDQRLNVTVETTQPAVSDAVLEAYAMSRIEQREAQDADFDEVPDGR